MTPPAAPAPITRTLIDLPPGHKLTVRDRAYPIALSPDGSAIAFVSEFDGHSQLFVRELPSLEPRPIPGTTGARQPFFSPDGRSVAFFASGALQKVSVAGGNPIRICGVPTLSVGGSWGANDLIVFATVCRKVCPRLLRRVERRSGSRRRPGRLARHPAGGSDHPVRDRRSFSE